MDWNDFTIKIKVEASAPGIRFEVDDAFSISTESLMRDKAAIYARHLADQIAVAVCSLVESDQT